MASESEVFTTNVLGLWPSVGAGRVWLRSGWGHYGNIVDGFVSHLKGGRINRHSVQSLLIKDSALRLFKLALATSAEFDKMSQHNIPAHLNDLRRHQIIDRIRDFFLENKIEVTSENLLTVHAAYSGESPRLARKFSVMREENRPITQAWLDHITQNDEDIAQRDNAQQMLNRLSSRLEVFTSAAARA
jgi:benzoyl-CoA reductase/2-hydroxyglutaryl-CoA dehydratase subunit BcrC/BadD/HgdB